MKLSNLTHITEEGEENLPNRSFPPSPSYNFESLNQDPDELISNQVRPKGKTTYFCRLCGSYAVKLPKAHLRDYHKADYRRTQNKAYDDIIKVLFTRCI